MTNSSLQMTHSASSINCNGRRYLSKNEHRNYLLDPAFYFDLINTLKNLKVKKMDDIKNAVNDICSRHG